MADDSSFCKHCKRLVPSATFILHSTHCERFIQICQSCEEAIPRAQMQQHEHEVHQLVNCKDCDEPFEKGVENNHLANHCSKRLITCQYCEVQCIATKVQDHELACGSRTEMCEVCKNHILVRMLKIREAMLHNDSSIKSTGRVEVINQTSGLKESPSDTKAKVVIPKFRNVVCQNIFQASAALPTVSQPKMNEGSHSSANEMEDQPKLLLPCEISGTLCPEESLHANQMACNSNLKSCSSDDASDLPERPTDHPPTSSRAGPSDVDDDYWSRYSAFSPATKESMVDEEASIPCEFCGTLFPLSCLELHQVACEFSELSAETDFAIRRKETATRRPASPCDDVDDYWSQYPAVAPAAEQDVAIEDIGIPCENCGTLFPISSLDIHEISCKFSKISTESEETSQVSEKTGPIASTSRHLSEPEPALLPCSYCHVIISSSILEMHEARCRPFSEQQMHRSRPSAAQSGPEKSRVKNSRVESAAQQSRRHNALVATETRLPSTPKIQQSQYAVVQLTNGQEILKKRRPSLDANVPDVGRVLGHGQPQGRRHDDSFTLHTAIYANRKNAVEGPNSGWETKTVGTHQSSLNEYRGGGKSLEPMRRIGKIHASVQKRNTVQKKNGTLPTYSNAEMRIAKKPNAAFRNVAYQPDAGNKLGGGNSSIRERPRNATAPGSYFHPGNIAEYRNYNRKDGEHVGDGHQNGRDYSSAFGARPKRP